MAASPFSIVRGSRYREGVQNSLRQVEKAQKIRKIKTNYAGAAV
ncbi:MAG TPA: hypothetical protein PLH24_04210 [Candidatus Atribacteria bacterium]|nr:hypothetical protein [Candidatus Atribacteria bacterium]